MQKKQPMRGRGPPGCPAFPPPYNQDPPLTHNQNDGSKTQNLRI